MKDRLACAHYLSINVIESDFEAEAHGHLRNPLGIFTIADHFRNQVKITNRFRSEGKSSLELINTAELSPYIYIKPQGYNRGQGVLSFDIRVEEGACPWIDFRTSNSRKTAPVGPSIRIRKGRLSVDGRKGTLCTVKPEKWHKMEISFPLNGCGTYSLKVVSPDGKSHVFNDLSYVSGDEFKSCSWIGVLSTGREEAKFQLDNFSLVLLNKWRPPPYRP